MILSILSFIYLLYSKPANLVTKDISPKVLKEILGSSYENLDSKLLVGHESSDDAAVYDLGDGRALISTTDFFMPIVDDPFHFGMIAGSNALSDVYAMGGKPLMAISIFGWPINLLPAEIGAKVIDGGREICNRAGIALAGGHSIDSPEPIFGLSVSGIVEIKNLKKNIGARPGDNLFLTKPLGIGVLSTAQKKKVVTQSESETYASENLHEGPQTKDPQQAQISKKHFLGSHVFIYIYIYM